MPEPVTSRWSTRCSPAASCRRRPGSPASSTGPLTTRPAAAVRSSTSPCSCWSGARSSRPCSSPGRPGEDRGTPRCSLLSAGAAPRRLRQLGLVRRRADRRLRLSSARRRPVLAGVLLGLAIAAKFYPVVLLGPLLLLCLRGGQLRSWPDSVAAALAWLAVNLPVPPCSGPHGWARGSTSVRRSASAGFGSPWYALDRAGWTIPDDRLNLVSGGSFLLFCVRHRRPRPLRSPQAAGGSAGLPRRLRPSP